MDMYKAGAYDALLKVGVDRPRFLDEPDELALVSPHTTPESKVDYYRNYLQDVAGHQVQPKQQYVDDTREGGGIAGGVAGGILGAGIGGLSKTPSSGKRALIGGLGGAALGGLAGYGLGGPMGRSMHKEDTAEVANAGQLLENDPAMRDAFARETAGIDQYYKQQAIQQQQAHERAQQMRYLMAANQMANRFAPQREGQ